MPASCSCHAHLEPGNPEEREGLRDELHHCIGLLCHLYTSLRPGQPPHPAGHIWDIADALTDGWPSVLPADEWSIGKGQEASAAETAAAWLGSGLALSADLADGLSRA